MIYSLALPKPEMLIRLGEDYLAEMQESFAEDSNEYLTIEDELNRRAQSLSFKEEARKAREEAKRSDLELIRSNLGISPDSSSAWVPQAIQEFGDDYKIKQEPNGRFNVHSYVAREFQNSDVDFPTMKEAEARVRYLLWNRMYDTYVRTGDQKKV